MSIIGNSVIYAQALTVTGPTGNIGPAGPTGPRGATGITLGPTGASGIFIRDVISNLTDNTISFVLSDNSNIELFGFTGSDVYYYNSDGVSSAMGSDKFSLFLGVSGGITFNFCGICGDGQYVIPSLSSDRSEVLLTINPLGYTFPFGTSNSNYVAYVDATEKISSSKIRAVTFTEDTDAGFGTDTRSYIEFGLTGTTSVSGVRTFTQIQTPFITLSSNAYGDEEDQFEMPGIKRKESGGYVLNLDDASVFVLTTPIGITAFNYTKLDGSGENDISSWLFFVNGSDVWNLPKELKFTGDANGIGSYAFTKGTNILKITKKRNDTDYYATFVDRFIGDATDATYRPIGSCKFEDNSCVDYYTQQRCEGDGGVFTALQSCDTSVLGRCCLGTGVGDCRDGISEDVCAGLGGSWNAGSCTPGICVPPAPSYTIQNIQFIKNIDNTISDDFNRPTTIIKFDAVVNNSPSTNLRLFLGGPSSSIDTPNLNYNLSRTGIVPCAIGFSGGNFITGSNSAKRIFNGTTPFEIIAFQENISSNSEQFVQPDTLIFKPIFRDASVSPIKTVAISSIGITAEYKPFCGRNLGYYKIKTQFIAENWCRDCFTFSSDGVETRIPVQDVYGTFDFCINPQTLDIKKNCISTSTVFDKWDCKNSAVWTYSTNENSKQCVHRLHELGVNGTDTPCTSEDCKQAGFDGQNIVCKGQDTSNSKGYWTTVKLKNENGLLYNLAELGLTLNDCLKVVNDVRNLIEGITGPNVNESIFFNPNNITIGRNGPGSEQQILWSSDSNCCTPETPEFSSNLLMSPDFTRYRYFLYQMIQYHTIAVTINCCNAYDNGTGVIGDGDQSSSTDSYLVSIVHRVEKDNLDTNENLIDPSNPGCFETIPTGYLFGCGNNPCRWGASCGGASNSRSRIDYFGPSYVGEITESEVIGDTIPIVNANNFTRNQFLHWPVCIRNFEGLILENWKTIANSGNASTISRVKLATKNDIVKTHWALNNICACNQEIYNYCGDRPDCSIKQYCSLDPFRFDPSYNVSYCNSIIASNTTRRIIILEKASSSNTASSSDPFETWNVFVYKFNTSTNSWSLVTTTDQQRVWFINQPTNISDSDFNGDNSNYPIGFQSTFGTGSSITVDRRKDFKVYITSNNTSSPEESSVLFEEMLPAIPELSIEPTTIKNGSLWIKSDVGAKDNVGIANNCNLRIEAGLDCKSGVPCTFDELSNLDGWGLGRWEIYLRYPSTTPVILRGKGRDQSSGLRVNNTYPFNEWFDTSNWSSPSNNNVLDTCGTFEPGSSGTFLNEFGQTETYVEIYANVKLLFRKFNTTTFDYDYINKFYYTKVRISTTRDTKSIPKLPIIKNKLLKDPITGISQCVLIDCTDNPTMCSQYEDC